MDWESGFSRLGKDLQPSALTELMDFVSKDAIPFSGGLPHPSSFPVAQVKEVMNDILTNEPVPALQYGGTQGSAKLIEFLRERSEKNGIHAEAGNFLITSGSQQALDLLARLFIDPGDEVIVESPTYLGALGPFSNQKAVYSAVPMDEKGIIPDALEQILKSKKQAGKAIKFIYLIPTFQNPTGVTLETERRRRVVELAKEHDVLVIEDDPYGELRYAGDRVPPIKSFDTDGHVIYLSTFSKIFSPGARMGWVIAHRAVIEKLIYLKESVDLHSSTLVQSLVYEYCRRGYLEEHIKEIIPIYAVRREAMINAMDEYFDSSVSWTRPDGGFFVWVTLPKEMDTRKMFPKAAANKVTYVPGYAFYHDGSGQNTMRLSFSATNEDQIREGVRRLAEVFGVLKD
jgi:2-aminoadipate transaminase